MSRQRAVTLAELMVACFVLTLVSGVCSASLILVNRYWTVASAEVSAQINAQVALDRLRRELGESTLASLSVSKTRVSFLTARDVGGRFQTSAEGLPIWSAYLVYYVRGSDQSLMRLRVEADGEEPLSAEQLDELCQGQGSLTAYGITDLSVTIRDEQVALAVVCQTSAGGRGNQLGLSTVLRVRN